MRLRRPNLILLSLIAVAQAGATQEQRSGAGPGVERVQAVAASNFTRMLAVQVHMNYNRAWPAPRSPYDSVKRVLDALDYLNPLGVGTGFGVVRDTAFYDNAIGGLNTLGQHGYKLDLYTGYDASHKDYRAEYDAMSQFVSSGFVRMVEGGLEVDNFGLTEGMTYTALNGTAHEGWSAAIAMQADLWSRFHARVPVALFSLANPANGRASSPAVAAAAKMNLSLSSIANYGNVHFYQHNGRAPGSPTGGELAGIIAAETGNMPGMPFIISETGLNDINRPDVASQGTPAVNAKYTLTLLLDSFLHHSVLTCYYELFDENMGYSDNAFEDHWGLFSSDGTPKPAATALRSMLMLIGDKHEVAKPDSLPLNITGLQGNGRSLLLEKSDASFIIVVWADADIYSDRTLVRAPPQDVAITFETPWHVHVADPLQVTGSTNGDADGWSDGKVARVVHIQVTDHPILVRVGPEKFDGPGRRANSPEDPSAPQIPQQSE